MVHGTLRTSLILLALMAPALSEERGLASVDTGDPTPFDGANYHGRVATGERFNPYAMAAAHRTLSLGTIVQVDYPRGQIAYVRINDRGPCLSKHCQKLRPDLKKRIIDLTPEAADIIGLPGIGQVIVRVCKIHKVSVNKEQIPVRTCT